MNVEIVKSDKNEAEIKVSSVTVAELLRAYLYEQGADLAVWRRPHPTEPAVMKIQTSGKTVKKVFGDAVSAIKKDLEKLSKLAKK